MQEMIKKKIEQHEAKGDFTYAVVNDDMILEAEKKLNLTIPDIFIQFLKTYGSGGIGGVATLGACLDNSLSFVDETFEYRDMGLPRNLIVIENVDEWLYCLDSRDGHVVSWASDGHLQDEYENFDEYLIDQMNSAIENM